MPKLSQIFGARYHVIFYAAYGDFPHPCCFCGEEVDGHTKPWDSTSAIIHHVDHDRTNNDPANLAPAHRGCHIAHHSVSNLTRRRMSESQKRRFERDGPVVLDEAAREKIRRAKLGHVVSESQRAKQSAAMTGRTMSNEARQKMSAASKGKRKSDIHRANISSARKGLPSPFQGNHSRESLEKMRAAYRERPRGSCLRCHEEMQVQSLANHHRSSCLSPSQRAEVFVRWQAGERQVALAAEYGVSQPYVSTIVRKATSLGHSSGESEGSV